MTVDGTVSQMVEWRAGKKVFLSAPCLASMKVAQMAACWVYVTVALTVDAMVVKMAAKMAARSVVCSVV